MGYNNHKNNTNDDSDNSIDTTAQNMRHATTMVRLDEAPSKLHPHE
jgi:hypothetical protein